MSRLLARNRGDSPPARSLRPGTATPASPPPSPPPAAVSPAPVTSAPRLVAADRPADRNVTAHHRAGKEHRLESDAAVGQSLGEYRDQQAREQATHPFHAEQARRDPCRRVRGHGPFGTIHQRKCAPDNGHSGGCFLCYRRPVGHELHHDHQEVDRRTGWRTLGGTSSSAKRIRAETPCLPRR